MLLAICLPAAFHTLLLGRAFAFEPPVQVTDLAYRQVSPIALVEQNNIWWARYLVVQPALWAMDHWGLRYDYAFALYSATLLAVEAYLLGRVARLSLRPVISYSLGTDGPIAIGIALAVVAVGTQQNGRVIPAHIGMGLLLVGQMRAVMKSELDAVAMTTLVAGLLTSHMTSGTGLIAFLDLVAGSAIVVFAVPQMLWRWLGFVWLTSAAFGPLLVRELQKNLDFFGGGLGALPGLLSHGAGALFLGYPALGLVAVSAVLVGGVIVWSFRRRLAAEPAVLRPIALALPMAAAGGLFGYSTLTMAVPPLITLAAHVATRLGRTIQRPAPQ